MSRRKNRRDQQTSKWKLATAMITALTAIVNLMAALVKLLDR